MLFNFYLLLTVLYLFFNCLFFLRFYIHSVFHTNHSLQVRKEALSRLSPAHRNNHTAVLGATTLEFGLYCRQTFKWAPENATGWVVGVVAQILEEESRKSVDPPISAATSDFFEIMPCPSQS